MNNHPGIINNRFHLGLLIHLANQFKDQLISQHFSGMDITAAQFKVLIIMAQFGVDTPAELCRNLSLDSGSMTRMLDRLEQKDLLSRKRSELDRRQVQLVLTEDGQHLADMLPHIGAEALNQLAGALEPGELETLEKILKKILIAAGDSITLQLVGKQ